MPQGNKGKRRTRKKHQKSSSPTQDPADVHAPEGVEQGEGSHHLSPVFVGALPSSPAAHAPQGSLRGRPFGTPGSAGTDPNSDADEEQGARARLSDEVGSEIFLRDPLNRKSSHLVKFLLEKFINRQPFTHADMLNVISKKYKKHFPEILRRSSVRVELVYGLELEEVDPSNRSYILVNKLSLSSEDSLTGERSLPKTGLVMTLLAVIFMKGSRAPEEEMWQFLSSMGVYAGKDHPIYGEPKKFLTQDLVEEQYLEYRQVPHRRPPAYEFLWGPRAYAETSKMEVLEMLAKINDTTPYCFPVLYEEALRDQQERAELCAVDWTSTAARAQAGSQAMSHRYSHT